jgi:hypothetical protein
MPTHVSKVLTGRAELMLQIMSIFRTIQFHSRWKHAEFDHVKKCRKTAEKQNPSNI